MAKQTNSLAHTKWMCKYHIIFPPSIDERLSIINIKRMDILKHVLKQLCSYKGVEILEGNLMPDYVHFILLIIDEYEK